MNTLVILLWALTGAVFCAVLYEGWFWLARALDRRGLAAFIAREEEAAREAERRRLDALTAITSAARHGGQR